MGDLLFDSPCVLFALRREARAFLRRFPPQQRFPGAPCPACFCGSSGRTVLILETGIGVARTGTALEWLLNRPQLGTILYRPKLVVSAGFCGALADDLQVGDLLLATEVVDPQGRTWPTTWPGELPVSLRRGRLLTAAEMLTTPEEKRDLGSRYSAAAVDMESAIVAELCSRERVPFGCLRAVSDDARTALSPRLASLLAGGRASPLRLLAHLVRSPRLAGELLRLARHTRRAADQLGETLGKLLIG